MFLKSFSHISITLELNFGSNRFQTSYFIDKCLGVRGSFGWSGKSANAGDTAVVDYKDNHVIIKKNEIYYGHGTITNRKTECKGTLTIPSKSRTTAFYYSSKTCRIHFEDGVWPVQVRKHPCKSDGKFRKVFQLIRRQI